MTTPDPSLLFARRAVAAPGWRWMRGMSTVSGWVVVSVDGDLVTLECPGYTRRIHTMDRVNGGEYPELTDPATQGCLMYLAKERHGDDPGLAWMQIQAFVRALEAPVATEPPPASPPPSPEAFSPEVFFYGVWPGTGAGHYLHDRHGRHVGSRRDLEIGCKLSRHPGGRYPWDIAVPGNGDYRRAQTQGLLHWWQGAGIAHLSCWDRSEDTRGNCCSAFIFLGPPLPREAALALARETYPAVFARMEAAGIQITWAEPTTHNED